jgi:hypothetical protein
VQLSDRQDFERMLRELFGAIGQTLSDEKVEGFWKGLASLQLIEFGRCVDQLYADLKSTPAPKTYTVGHVWQAKRALRASPPMYPHPQRDNDGWDGWSKSANHHLLTYVKTALSARPRRYGDGGISGRVGPGERRWSAEFERNIARLVAAKNAWVSDMRDLAAHGNGEVAVERQREIWSDYLQRAEAEIAV